MKRDIAKIFIIILLSLVLLVLSGCPSTMDTESVKNGGTFRFQITNKFLSCYNVEFEEEDVPFVSIEYQLPDKTKKVAAFQLDGYNNKDKIGYKLVLSEDKEIWRQNRENGDTKAPDLNDELLIRKECLKYQFPIVFLSAYQYQNDSDNKALSDLNEFLGTLDEIMESSEIKQWAKKIMYSGELIKDYIVEQSKNDYNIQFSDKELPTIEVSYGNDQKAYIQLDGYDSNKQIGYKFVTATEEKAWNQERKEGNLEVPDLSESELICESALKYNFPVFFIYLPEYWNYTLNNIYYENVSKYIVKEKNLSEWLKKN